MTTLLTAVISVVIFTTVYFSTTVYALGGSATTIAVVYGSNTTICGIVAGQQNQQIQCWRNGVIFTVFSNVSFETIAGGRNLLCGIRSRGYSLICFNPNFDPKRLYYNNNIILQNITVGDDQICALSNSTTRNVNCWRDDSFSTNSSQFRSISAGLGFTCGVLSSGNVTCWGNNQIASFIQGQFVNFTMSNIVVGGNHACGLNTTGFLICRGSNDLGQLNVPSSNSNSAYDFFAIALGANHTCALRRQNNFVICWGGGNVSMNSNVTNGVSFESIVAGLDFTCGLTSRNLSVICWGPGWVNNSNSLGQNQVELPLLSILPGPCVQSDCPCGIYPQSQELCSGFGSICRSCDVTNSFIPIPPPSVDNSPQSSSPSRGLRRGLLAFAIVGSVGAFAGICSIIYCLWTGVCCGKKKIHNSVQPTINHIAPQQSYSSPVSRSSTIRRQGSRIGFRRQRSGTSSKHADRAEEFTFADLALAANNFSPENKIGAGSFGVVYRGKLLDGREVAIKRGETSQKIKKFQEKETAFDSELEFLSRLHHKHLVRLVGYCEEGEERLLVYEYMKNGALYDHLHDKKNVEKNSSPVNSWKMRIKISLDAARGIEYLHSYAVPPIIHRDIKSSNILLDSNWVARVSDFGLSLLGPESDQEYRPTKAAGTVGYIDPEYYGLNVLTAKSDVYGLGVVLLELLTGKRAIFKSGENGGEPTSLVDFAVPEILDGQLAKILDKRVGPPEVNEVEGVELLARTAVRCVNLEGRDRPTMTDIVSNLEGALGFCDNSHGSISSGGISIISE